MADDKAAKKRLSRDMRDLADAKEEKAAAIRALAQKLDDGDITARELLEECKERQVLMELPF
jgi:hypothetical protein